MKKLMEIRGDVAPKTGQLNDHIRMGRISQMHRPQILQESSNNLTLQGYKTTVSYTKNNNQLKTSKAQPKLIIMYSDGCAINRKMESLLIRVKEVLEALKKNDDSIEKLSGDAKNITEKVKQLNWANNKLETIDRLTTTNPAYELTENLQNSSIFKYSQNKSINDRVMLDSDNAIDMKKCNTTLVNEVDGLQNENRRLIKENEHLASLLVEHSTVLQYAMEKYRAHVMELLNSKDGKFVMEARKVIEELERKIAEKDDKLSEMINVIRTAISLDSETSKNELEWISQLFSENKLLRKLLEVKRTASSDQLWDEIYRLKQKTEMELMSDESDDKLKTMCPRSQSDYSTS